tara:strand:+ start:4543 stop:5187 length:645 start_codon:yes stop_codon:yes gene_type:complete
MKQNTIFETLGKLQVSDKTQKKGRFTYLSWAWAWHILKQNYPEAQRKVYENPEGVPYFTDGKFANVKVGITINGLEHIDYLPITDNSNRSIPLVKITSFQVNTAIQRSTAKAIALHGLALSLWIDEDTTKCWDTPDAPPKSTDKKKDTDKYTIQINDPEKWDDMMDYVVKWKAKGLTWIINNISKEYIITKEVENQIKIKLNGKGKSTKKTTKR